MGLCNSKSIARKTSTKQQFFNPVDSYQSTRSMLHHDHKKTIKGLKPKNKTSTKELKRSDIQNSFNGDMRNENSIDLYEMEHQILKDVWQGNFCCDIRAELQTEKNYVLDVACGPGHWIRDMSYEFPKSHFIGIQASPCHKVEPSSNTDIFRIDILDGLSYGNDSFDYVHMSCLGPNFSKSDWEKTIQEMVRVTKPQGIIEIVVGSCDCENSGPIMKKLCNSRRAFLETKGVEVDISKRLESLMKNTQKFVSLEKQTRKIPIGKSEIVGEMFQSYFTLMIESYRDPLSSYLGQSHQEFDETLNSLNSELDRFKNSNFHCIRIVGKKL
ncbi:8618_t:CDS:2 [Cetraspora pellucida]|uniref:8618_t:CDS:1 n=1 Tax=Cetraspora pellucida TaxID=1433469 RepID=A0A9N8ZFE8_9GLOM|nr:8618_t:CDS:2 [Cetraspora pellucida]